MMVTRATGVTPLTAMVPLLGRRDRRAVYSGKWKRFDGDPAALITSHLTGRIVLGTHHGGEPTTMVMATETDGGSHETLSRNLGRPVDAKAATIAIRAELGRLGFMPPIIASSKSGDGYHVRGLFSEPVSSELARLTMRTIKERVGLDEIDVVYPGASGDGLVLALPLAGLEGPCPFIKPGGSRFVHPASLEPYHDDAQLEILEHWPRSTPEMLEKAAERLGLHLLPEDRSAPRTSDHDKPTKRAVESIPAHCGDLDVLAERCAFIEHAAADPASLSYEEWFSLATVLAPFPGGAVFFDSISKGDVDRYRPGEPVRKIDSVTGKPRHCTSLGWSCPKRAECAALGVNSPAGLPFRLGRSRRAA